MREYLRRECSEGWVIDASPEGMRPDVPTRFFPSVQQRLAIGIFVKTSTTASEVPAVVHHTTVDGKRAEKYRQLSKLSLDSKPWRLARPGWDAPFTPAADSAWDDYPALADLLPWTVPGVKPNRTWVYSPSRSALLDRWKVLIAETNLDQKKHLFKESRDAKLGKVKDPLPGVDTHKFSGPFESEVSDPPSPVGAGFRSFDRQWLIPDSRLIHGPSPDLWAARIPQQVFVVEQHAHPIESGPGLVFSALLTDMHYFNNRGGRVLPMLHPDGSTNLTPGLASALDNAEGDSFVDAADVIAYIAGVVSHPAFTQCFADELTTPGIRVPITEDAGLWNEAIELGRQVVWLHTYGEAFANNENERPDGNIRFAKGDERQPLALKPITKMPEEMAYDADSRVLKLGDGEWGPVSPAVIDYEVGGRNVLKSWFNYRKRKPTGRKTSPLDDIQTAEWPSEWTVELIDLLTVLTRLVELEPAQADLLERILDGPIATKDELAERGVQWPTTKKNRAPRRGGLGSGTEHQPTLSDKPE